MNIGIRAILLASFGWTVALVWTVSAVTPDLKAVTRDLKAVTRDLKAVTRVNAPT